MKKIIYSKYSNERSEQFNIRTDIVLDKNHVKSVQKKPLSESSKRHIDNIYKAYLELTKVYQNSRFDINRCQNIDGGIEFEFLEGISFDEYLDRHLETKEYNLLLEELREYIDVIRDNNSSDKFQVSEDFVKVFGHVDLPDGLMGNSVTNIDMVANNAILNHGNWHMIDYEWTFFFLIPVNYVIYRIVHYYLCGNSKRQVLTETSICEYVGLTDYEVEQYKIMEENFQSYILGECVPVRNMHEIIGQDTVNFGRLMEEKAYNDIRSIIEVYFDYGEGFRDENKACFSVRSDEDNLKTLNLSVPENVIRIRIDPANDSCIVCIKDIIAVVDNKNIELGYYSNGYQVDEKRIVFVDEDPQITLLEYQDNMRDVSITFSVEMVSFNAARSIKTVIEELQNNIIQISDIASELSYQDQSNKELIGLMESTTIWRIYEKYRSLREKAKKLRDNVNKRLHPDEEVLYTLELPSEESNDEYGIINIKGWVIAKKTKKVKVIVRVHNKNHKVSVNIERADVSKVFSDYGDKALLSGFFYRYQIPDEFLRQDHLVEVIIKSKYRTIIEERMVKAQDEKLKEVPSASVDSGNAPEENILYNLEMPIENSSHNYGIINVEGWVIATLSENIDVSVYIHDEVFKAATGLRRNDVKHAFESHDIPEEKTLYSGFYFEYKIPDEYLDKDHTVKVVIKSQYHTIEEERIVKNHPKEEIYLLKGEINKIYKPYEIWTLKHQLNDEVIRLMEKNIEEFSSKPLISIVMPTFNPELGIFKEAIDSVISQIYTNWELCVVDDCSSNINVEEIIQEYIKCGYPLKFKRLNENSNISVATNEGVAMANGEFIFLMDHDDLITKDALYEVTRVINEQEDADVIYSDDDKISMDGKRFAPQFKPDYSPELLLSFMYFSHIFVIKKDLYDKVGGCRNGYEGSQDFDLALRVTEEAKRVVHIPKILYHWRATPTSTASSASAKPESIERGLKAVQDAVDRRKIPASAYIPEFAKTAGVGIFALKYESTSAPKVSIVIPTKNHMDILKRCIDSIEEKTTYANYEIVIVDNDSDDGETLDYLAGLSHKIVKVKNSNGQFNFSRMVNEGVANSTGDYVILLNNDTEVIASEWIENLLIYMQIKGVGVVGTKLLYEDKLVQHAGVLLGVQNGVAAHAFKLLPEWHGGYLSFAKVARNYSAVTAAAFMTKKEIYVKVCGFSEADFSVSYNDVDFCMKVQKEGFRVVYNPESLLYHHEGKSRGVEQTGHFSDPREEFNFVSKWLEPLQFEDPYYNVNLSKEDEKFELELGKVAQVEHFPMKVLLLTNNLNFEGAPIVQLTVARYLLKKGYSFGVLSPNDGPLREEYEKYNIPVIVNPECYHASDNYDEVIDCAAKNFINKDYNLIYANTLDCFWGIDLGEKLNIPSLLGIHESAFLNIFFQNKAAEIIERAGECIKKATKVIYVAEATAKIFGAFDTYNTAVIRNGIDFEKVNYFKDNYDSRTVRKECNIDEDAIVVSIFGTLCLRKGQELFVKVAKLIKEKSNQKVVFLMIGSKNSIYGESVVNKVKEYGMEADFRILDAQPDIYKYYLITDVYVCASYEESSPLVTLEAMAFRRAIVSTNVFGIPEQIRDGREALLCEPGDEKVMASLILKLMNDKALREELSYNAYYRVKTYFSIEQMMNQYDEVFQSSLVEGDNKVYKAFLEDTK